MNQSLYVPPPLEPAFDTEVHLVNMLDGTSLHQTDINSTAWQMRMCVEEFRYANVVDEFSRSMGSKLRRQYEEELRQLDENSGNEDE